MMLERGDNRSGVGAGPLGILHGSSPELEEPSVGDEALLTKAAAVVTLKMMSLNSSNHAWFL